MINHYLENRKNLSAIFLLIDSRHGPSEDDLAMLEWIKYYEKEYFIVATKIDKLKASQREDAIKLCKEKTGTDDEMIVFSAVTGEGVDTIKQIMQDLS
jgi:GTP-binding protein